MPEVETMRKPIAVLAFMAGALPACVLAAPNDFRVVSGTLLHPAALATGAPVAVVRSDDGTVYHADLRTVSGVPALDRGGSVTVVGFEGARPDQLMAQVVYAPEPSPAPAAPAERPRRIDGRIESLVGPTVVVRAADGSTVVFLLRGVRTRTRGLLQKGDAVTVFGRPAETEFVVTGIIQRQN
jgi:hypothetical protein